MTLLIWRSVGGLHYPSCHVLLRPGPPGERAERFCGLQHPGPPDPLGLVRELQPALWGCRGRRARYVHTVWWMGCLHSSTVTDRYCQTHMLSNFSWKKKSKESLHINESCLSPPQVEISLCIEDESFSSSLTSPPLNPTSLSYPCMPPNPPS